VEGLGLALPGHAGRREPLKRIPAAASFSLTSGALTAASMSLENSCRELLLGRAETHRTGGRPAPSGPCAGRRAVAASPRSHSPWSDEAVLASVRRQLLPVIQRRGQTARRCNTSRCSCAGRRPPRSRKRPRTQSRAGSTPGRYGRCLTG